MGEAGMRIGDVTILPVLDGTGVEDARDSFRRRGFDGDAWECHAHHLDDSGRLALEVGAFLVVSGDRRVLVDAGLGPAERDLPRPGYRGGDLLTSLAAHGFEPGDITDVVFSHLHFDHVGWASDQDKPTFPGATYRVHAADWEHFVTRGNGRPAALAALAPITGQLETFDADVVIAHGVSARHTPGHTPGSTVYVVADQGQRALLLGDLVHTVVELHERDWEAVFDVDPVTATAARNAIADDIADTDAVVNGPHFPGLRFGRVVTTGGDRVFRSL